MIIRIPIFQVIIHYNKACIFTLASNSNLLIVDPGCYFFLQYCCLIFILCERDRGLYNRQSNYYIYTHKKFA